MLTKLENYSLNNILLNKAKITFWGNLIKGCEAEFIANEYKKKLFTVHQIHSSNVFILDANTDVEQSVECDAIITKQKDIIIGIKTADCVPIIFADVKNGIVAVAHAGWKGAREGVIDNTINAISKLTHNLDLIAVIGPCIHQISYEVKQDFVDEFMTENMHNAQFFKKVDSRVFFDLPAYVKFKLSKFNVISTIYDIDVNTFASSSFSSYRRDGQPRITSNLSTIVLTADDNHDFFASSINGKINIDVLNQNKMFKGFDNDEACNDFKKKLFDVPNSVSPAQNLHDNIKPHANISESEKNNILKNIKNGKVKIMSQIDLHGYNADSAFKVLSDFIYSNFHSGLRYLMVITGKGRTGESILRQSFVNWLENNNDLRQYVLTYIESLPHHGGSGAFYLILKKNAARFL